MTKRRKERTTTDSYSCVLLLGKTLLLVLVGLRWLLQGHDVHIVSAHLATLAVSLMIQHQLQNTLKAQTPPTVTAGAVFTHQFDFINSEQDVTTAVTELTSAAQGGHLHVLVDEANFGHRFVEFFSVCVCVCVCVCVSVCACVCGVCVVCRGVCLCVCVV